MHTQRFRSLEGDLHALMTPTGEIEFGDGPRLTTHFPDLMNGWGVLDAATGHLEIQLGAVGRFSLPMTSGDRDVLVSRLGVKPATSRLAPGQVTSWEIITGYHMHGYPRTGPAFSHEGAVYHPPRGASSAFDPLLWTTTDRLGNPTCAAPPMLGTFLGELPADWFSTVLAKLGTFRCGTDNFEIHLISGKGAGKSNSSHPAEGRVWVWAESVAGGPRHVEYLAPGQPAPSFRRVFQNRGDIIIQVMGDPPDLSLRSRVPDLEGRESTYGTMARGITTHLRARLGSIPNPLLLFIELPDRTQKYELYEKLGYVLSDRPDRLLAARAREESERAAAAQARTDREERSRANREKSAASFLASLRGKRSFFALIPAAGKIITLDIMRWKDYGLSFRQGRGGAGDYTGEVILRKGTLHLHAEWETPYLSNGGSCTLSPEDEYPYFPEQPDSSLPKGVWALSSDRYLCLGMEWMYYPALDSCSKWCTVTQPGGGTVIYLAADRESLERLLPKK